MKKVPVKSIILINSSNDRLGDCKTFAEANERIKFIIKEDILKLIFCRIEWVDNFKNTVKLDLSQVTYNSERPIHTLLNYAWYEAVKELPSLKGYQEKIITQYQISDDEELLVTLPERIFSTTPPVSKVRQDKAIIATYYPDYTHITDGEVSFYVSGPVSDLEAEVTAYKKEIQDAHAES